MNRLFFLLLISLSLAAHAQEEQDHISALDSAYAAALNNPDKQSAFYRAFLNTELYIPTHTKPETETRRRASADESIYPIIVESKGIQHLMIFDSKERLSSWAKSEIGFVAMQGHAIVGMINPDIHWILNVGTNHMKVFVPDEIQWIKETIAKSKVNHKGPPKGTRVSVGTPSVIPDGLIESLTKTLVKTTEVKRAFLGLVHYDIPGEKPHLILVFEVNELRKTIIDDITDNLAFSANGFLGQYEYIDITFNDGTRSAKQVAKQIAEIVDPFYVRPK